MPDLDRGADLTGAHYLGGSIDFGVRPTRAAHRHAHDDEPILDMVNFDLSPVDLNTNDMSATDMAGAPIKAVGATPCDTFRVGGANGSGACLP